MLLATKTRRWPSGALWSSVVEALSLEGLSRESVLADLGEALDGARRRNDAMAIRAIGNAVDCLSSSCCP
jgi:hypothetical protein